MGSRAIKQVKLTQAGAEPPDGTEQSTEYRVQNCLLHNCKMRYKRGFHAYIIYAGLVNMKSRRLTPTNVKI
jgi:hypothetical protein